MVWYTVPNSRSPIIPTCVSYLVHEKSELWKLVQAVLQQQGKKRLRNAERAGVMAAPLGGGGGGGETSASLLYFSVREGITGVKVLIYSYS